eukprot:222839-Rhodomonas_salina.4
MMSESAARGSLEISRLPGGPRNPAPHTFQRCSNPCVSRVPRTAMLQTLVLKCVVTGSPPPTPCNGVSGSEVLTGVDASDDVRVTY